MNVDISKDLDAATLVVSTEFDAPPERVWQIWADPRKLEKWWGPPTYPATVTEHDLTPGGRVNYHMTGPEGDQHGGWWAVRAVDAPLSLEFEDGFADASGEPNTDMPTGVMRVTLVPSGVGTTMTVTTTYKSREDLEAVLKMGMAEGISAAMGQIPAVLAEA